MDYNDGIPYDPKTMRVRECPRCHNSQFQDNSLYCRICGLELYNICIGNEERDSWGNPIYSNQHKNPSNARFCEICGKPTVYNIRGILPQWNEYEKSVQK